MKCIILAAGEGVRMRPLTLEVPKPMVLVAGKPLLEHIISELPKEIEELVIVVGYKREKIQEYFGERFGRFSIQYVVQEKKTGTFDALALCQPLLAKGEHFLMLYADDMHGHGGLRACVESGDLSLTVHKVENPERFGIIETDSDGYVVSLEEKPKHPKTDLASTGAFLLNTDVFDFVPPVNASGERVLAEGVGMMVKSGRRIKSIPSSLWIPIGYPQDLPNLEKYLADC